LEKTSATLRNFVAKCLFITQQPVPIHKKLLQKTQGHNPQSPFIFLPAIKTFFALSNDQTMPFRPVIHSLGGGSCCRFERTVNNSGDVL
jgi:hypothetical protein